MHLRIILESFGGVYMFKRKQIDMVNGPILKNMIIFTIPVMLAGLIQIVFNALDLIFAGQFCGTEGLKLARVELNTVSLTALNIGLCVLFCKASALLQTHASPDIKFVGRNSPWTSQNENFCARGS